MKEFYVNDIHEIAVALVSATNKLLLEDCDGYVEHETLEDTIKHLLHFHPEPQVREWVLDLLTNMIYGKEE